MYDGYLNVDPEIFILTLLQISFTNITSRKYEQECQNGTATTTADGQKKSQDMRKSRLACDDHVGRTTDVVYGLLSSSAPKRAGLAVYAFAEI